MKAAKAVKVEKFEQEGKHDHRFNLTLSRGPVKVRVCGYDMLPHLMSSTGKDYTRITWEQFRCLLTNDHYVEETAHQWSATFVGPEGVEIRSVLVVALTREQAVVMAKAYAKAGKWPAEFKLRNVEALN